MARQFDGIFVDVVNVTGTTTVVVVTTQIHSLYLQEKIVIYIS